MINIAICDDNKEVKNKIVEVLNKFFVMNNIKFRYHLFENYKELMKGYKEEKYNAVILDVAVKNGDGIEIAKELKKTDKSLEVIFISESQEYVFDAFDIDAFNYLLKPIDSEKLIKVVDKLVDKLGLLKNSSKYYVVKKSSSTRLINIRDIIFISVKNRIITIHCKNENISFYGKIEDVLEEINKLSSFEFIKTHRSYIINPFFVKKIEKITITLDGDIKIPVSRVKFKEIESEIYKYYSLVH